MKDQKDEIFQQLVKILRLFKKGMKENYNGAGKYELVGTKKVHAFNRDFDGMYFASAVIQKNFVSFYFFPQYSNPKLLAEMPDGLKKFSAGKSCFHIKKMDQDLLNSIKAYTKKGYDIYKKLGWI